MVTHTHTHKMINKITINKREKFSKKYEFGGSLRKLMRHVLITIILCIIPPTITQNSRF